MLPWTCLRQSMALVIRTASRDQQMKDLPRSTPEGDFLSLLTAAFMYGGSKGLLLCRCNVCICIIPWLQIFASLAGHLYALFKAIVKQLQLPPRSPGSRAVAIYLLVMHPKRR